MTTSNYPRVHVAHGIKMVVEPIDRNTANLWVPGDHHNLFTLTRSGRLWWITLYQGTEDHRTSVPPTGKTVGCSGLKLSAYNFCAFFYRHRLATFTEPKLVRATQEGKLS